MRKRLFLFVHHFVDEKTEMSEFESTSRCEKAEWLSFSVHKNPVTKGEWKVWEVFINQNVENVKNKNILYY